jgi:hypothetical protein
MSTGLGVLAKAAFRVEGASVSGTGLANTLYPTAPDTTSPHADEEEVKLGGSDQIPFTSEGLIDTHNFESDETIIGKAGAAGSDLVGIIPNGNIEVNAHYDGLDSLFACVMGFEKPLATDSPDYNPSTALEIATPATGQTTTNWVDDAVVFTSADVGKFIRTVDNARQGQVRRITAIPGSTGSIATVSPAWDVTPVAGDTGELAREFVHTFELANQISQDDWDVVYTSFPTGGVYASGDQLVHRGTLGIEKNQTQPWIFRSVMLNSMSISAQTGAGLTCSFECLPFDLDRDSATNTASSTWDWDNSSDVFEENERIVYSDMDYIRIDSYSTGTALTSADNRCVSGFELSLNNNLQGDDQSSCAGLYRVEPARGGMREITGSLTVPRYAADTFINWRDAETMLMAKVSFSGSTLATNPRNLTLWLTSFKLMKVGMPVSSAGVITQTIDFKCFVPAGQPASFPTLVATPKSELVIQTTNQNPFNPLIDQNKEY